MSRIVKLIFATALVLGLAGCKKDDITKPAKLECPLEVEALYKVNPKSNYYQLAIDDAVKKGLPGVSLLIWNDNGFFIGSAGRADIAENVIMQPCHLLKVGSITKFMLAVTIMRLQEQGILSINDPVSKYISKDILSKLSNGDNALTIKNLMNHTSGLYDLVNDEQFYLHVINDPSKHWKSDELIEYTYNKEAMFTFNPEDTAGYSNTNYLLLGMVLDAATGLPHSNSLNSVIIEPLQLHDTYYHWHDQLPADKVAQGYFDLYNNSNIENLTQWNTGNGNGYTGIYSNVWDMYLFIKALYVDKTLLAQPSLDQMLVFHSTMEDGVHLGLGCFKDFIDIGNPERDYAWGHRGKDLAYSTDLFYFPHHNTIMVLASNYGTNLESKYNTFFEQLRYEIAEIIIQ